MQIHLHEYGLDDLLLRVNSLADAGRARATRRRMLHAGIRVIERNTKNLMTGTRTGRVSIIGGKTHVASAPGEPPAVDTGNLKNSLRVIEVTDNYASFGSSADYAAELEYGLGRTAARPYMRPGAQNSVREIEDVMSRVVDEALDGR